jgi:hypothetical protein
VSNLRDELDEICRTLFKPKKEQKIWAWIEENCELPPESGAKFKGSINTGLPTIPAAFMRPTPTILLGS